MNNALPICVQHVSSWDNSRPEEMSAHIRGVCGVLCFVTRKFMKGLHSNFLRWDNCNTPWVRELHSRAPEFIPSFVLARSV